jgi:hypothetical protein
MRFRNPWQAFRLLRLGWYVRFILCLLVGAKAIEYFLDNDLSSKDIQIISWWPSQHSRLPAARPTPDPVSEKPPTPPVIAHEKLYKYLILKVLMVYPHLWISLCVTRYLKSAWRRSNQQAWRSLPLRDSS